MAQFKFKEGLILDFEGQEFTIYPDAPDFAEGWQEDCEEAARFSNELKGRRDAGAIREACEKLIELLENTLGDGAIASIFGERPAGFYDLLDIFQYISNEITAYRNQRQAETVPAPTNRAQRRQAAKSGARSTARASQVSTEG